MILEVSWWDRPSKLSKPIGIWPISFSFH